MKLRYLVIYLKLVSKYLPMICYSRKCTGEIGKNGMTLNSGECCSCLANLTSISSKSIPLTLQKIITARDGCDSRSAYTFSFILLSLAHWDWLLVMLWQCVLLVSIVNSCLSAQTRMIIFLFLLIIILFLRPQSHWPDTRAAASYCQIFCMIFFHHTNIVSTFYSIGRVNWTSLAKRQCLDLLPWSACLPDSSLAPEAQSAILRWPRGVHTTWL